jgi:hypothetical protein
VEQEARAADASSPHPNVEIHEVEAELDELVRRLQGYWSYRLGPLRVAAPLRSTHIFTVFIAFCLAAFIAGVVLTLTGVNELGVALTVGAIFAGGSFTAQLWTVQATKEIELDRLLSRGDVRRLHQLLDRWDDLQGRRAPSSKTGDPPER